MTKTALVMGGGGIVGIAWEASLLAALAEKGFHCDGADILFGTSAGSFISSYLALGTGPGRLVEAAASAGRAAADAESETDPVSANDPATLAEIFRVWTSAEVLDRDKRREIGALALSAKAAPESVMRGWAGELMKDEEPARAWPERLRISVVDAETGGFEVLTAESGVPVVDAAAASCSIPGMFSPVTIGSRRYMDGGVRSGTNADVLLEDRPDSVLIVAPLSNAGAPGLGRLMMRLMRDEIAALEAEGVRVCSIAPDEEDQRAFGLNYMDESRRRPAAEAGWARGLREADRVLDALGSFGT